MLLPLVLIGQVGPVDDAAVLLRRVSFSAPAAPVKRLMPQLAKLTGFTLEAVGNAGSDVVFLDIVDRPIGEVMQRLASVTHASWTKGSDGTYRLNRTSADATAMAEQERAIRTASLAAEFAPSAAELGRPVEMEWLKRAAVEFRSAQNVNRNYGFRPQAKIEGSFARTPMQRALLSTVSAVGFREFSLLQPGDRIVFSSRPTATQRALPASLAKVFERAVEEQRAWAQVNLAFPPLPSGGLGSDPLADISEWTAVPNKALLVAERTNSSALVIFTLSLLDAAGSLISRASLSVGDDTLRLSSRGAPKLPAILLSPQSVDYVAALSKFFLRNGPAKSLSRTQLTLLTQPERFDPLATTATDALRDLGRRTNKSVIGCLPDELAVAGLGGPAGDSIPGDQFWNSAAPMVIRSESADWVEVTPRLPYSARVARIDRSALGEYLRSIVLKGRVDLFDQARYAFRANEADYDTLGTFFAMLLDTSSTQNVDRDWPSLRLLGALTPSHLTWLVGGQPLLFSALTPSELKIASRRAMRGRFTSWSAPTPVGLSRPTDEPTELMPDGPPPAAAIELKASRAGDIVIASSTLKDVSLGYARVFNPEEMGATLAAQASGDPNFNPGFDRFQTTSRTEYRLSIRPLTTHQIVTVLTDVQPPAGLAVPLSGLPEAIRKQIEAGRDRWAKNPPPKAPGPPVRP